MRKGTKVTFRHGYGEDYSKALVLEGVVSKTTPAGKLYVYVYAEPDDPYVIYPSQVIHVCPSNG